MKYELEGLDGCRRAGRRLSKLEDKWRQKEVDGTGKIIGRLDGQEFVFH